MAPRLLILHHISQRFYAHYQWAIKRGSTSTTKFAIGLIGFIFASSFVFYAVFTLSNPVRYCQNQNAERITAESSTDCGHSAIDAHQRGCLFDPFNLAWQAPACHDGDLIRQFLDGNRLNRTTQGVFGNNAGTQKLTDDEIMRGHLQTVYVDASFLEMQCHFRWMEMNRILSHGGPIHALLVDEAWTTECSKYLIKESSDGKGEDILTARTVSFPVCRNEG